MDRDRYRVGVSESPFLAHGHKMAAVRVSPRLVSNQLENPLVLSLIAAGFDELSRVEGGQLI